MHKGHLFWQEKLFIWNAIQPFEPSATRHIFIAVAYFRVSPDSLGETERLWRSVLESERERRAGPGSSIAEVSSSASVSVDSWPSSSTSGNASQPSRCGLGVFVTAVTGRLFVGDTSSSRIKLGSVPAEDERRSKRDDGSDALSATALKACALRVEPDRARKLPEPTSGSKGDRLAFLRKLPRLLRLLLRSRDRPELVVREVGGVTCNELVRRRAWSSHCFYKG